MTHSNRKEKNRLFYLAHVSVDMLLVCSAFLIVLYYYKYIKNYQLNTRQSLLCIIPISLLSLIFFHIYGVFRCGRRTYKEIIFSATLSLTIVNFVSIAIEHFCCPIGIGSFIFVPTFLLQLCLMIIWKYIVFRLYPYIFKPKLVAFIGNGSNAYSIAQKVFDQEKRMFCLKYIFIDQDNDFESILDEVDAVFLCADVDNDYKKHIIYHCIGKGKAVYLIPELFEISLFHSKLTRFDDVPVVFVDDFNLTLEEKFVKRLFDIFVSLSLIIITSPIMLITYISIKLYDGGPAIFSQERITRWKKPFKLYKFRTMVVDAEKLTGPVLATEKDCRITPLGTFLRATRIDELPQLFNVLIGDMSIVGPRPERQYFIDQFSKELPYFEYRLSVKAGITGLAQILGKYTTTPMNKLKFDLMYIRDYSFLLDIKIILQTIKIIFMKGSSQGLSQNDLSGPSFNELRKPGTQKINH